MSDTVSTDFTRDLQLPGGLVILGFGGHARSVADVAMAAGISDFRFVDANARSGETFLDFPVVAELGQDIPAGWGVFPAAGDNRYREEQILTINRAGWNLVSLVAPTATIGPGCSIGPGSFVGHHAHIGPMAKIGSGCIINTGAVIEHECEVGSFSHVSVNATLAGRSRIGEQVMLGAGATAIDGIAIADRVVIGAGGVVTRSILEQGVYVGVPVRRVGE